MENDFTIVYNTLASDIFKLIFSYTLNIQDSKDILQNVFIKYFKNVKRYPNDITQIKKILIRIASNQSKNFLASKWHARTTLLEDLSNYQLANEEVALIKELKKISYKYRIVIYLYYYEGYKINEISDILKVKESTVKQRLKRAKEKLKNEMER